jgi:hypothetical protein
MRTVSIVTPRSSSRTRPPFLVVRFARPLDHPDGRRHLSIVGRAATLEQALDFARYVQRWVLVGNRFERTAAFVERDGHPATRRHADARARRVRAHQKRAQNLSPRARVMNSEL